MADKIQVSSASCKALNTWKAIRRRWPRKAPRARWSGQVCQNLLVTHDEGLEPVAFALLD